MRQNLQFSWNRSIFNFTGPSKPSFAARNANRRSEVRQKLSDTSGIWRDLIFWGRTQIFAFFEVLGLVLNVLKCVLKSEKFCINLGTLTLNKHDWKTFSLKALENDFETDFKKWRWELHANNVEKYFKTGSLEFPN